MTGEGDTHSVSITELILDELPSPVFVMDEHDFVYVNRSGAQLIGWNDPAQLRGIPVDQIMHPDAATAAAARRRLIIENGNRFDEVCVKLNTLDGRCARLKAKVSPIEHQGRTYVLAAVLSSTIG